MARISVYHAGITDLASDCRRIAVTSKKDMRRVVRRNVREGEKVSKKIAQSASGPHGSAYYKRITSEMTGPLEGEFGPHAGGTPVGAGYRHGSRNTDMLKAADLVGPKFAADVGDLPSRWFW